MGEAKRRGDFERKKRLAIRDGRDKSQSLQRMSREDHRKAAINFILRQVAEEVAVRKYEIKVILTLKDVDEFGHEVAELDTDEIRGALTQRLSADLFNIDLTQITPLPN